MTLFRRRGMNNKNDTGKGKFSFLKSNLTKSIIFSGIIIIIFAFLFIRYEGFFDMLGKVTRIFRPIIIGAVISFILNRPLNRINYAYQKLARKIIRNKLPAANKKRVKKKTVGENGNLKAPFILAVLTVYVSALAIITVLLLFIIPQFIDSIRVFTQNFDAYYYNFIKFIETNAARFDINLTQDFDFLEKLKKISFDDISKYAPDVLKATFGITASIFDYAFDFVKAIVDFIVGIIFSVYILSDKVRIKRQLVSLIGLVFHGKTHDRVIRYTKLTAETFTNFFSGQLTEAFLLGIFCFIGMKVIGFDYPLMISTIIGITNLIPIVGPIIGTIPGFIVMLLVNPSHAIWFVVFIIVLQQLESNLLYPRVVGNSVGLPALWVLLAVVVGGGLCGVFGMIIGIPIMSILYKIFEDEVEKKKNKEAEVAASEDKK